MPVTHVKKNQRKNHQHPRRRRRPSVETSRVLSAVTSIGSYEEPIADSKDPNKNDSISSKSNETKTSRPPTVITVVQVLQPPDQQQTIPNNIQPVLYPCRQKPLCSKIMLNQVSSLPAQIHPSQTSSSLDNFDPINTETPSRTSFKTKIYPHSTTQPISDPFVSEKNEDNNRQKSYCSDDKRRKRRERFCPGACLYCSPCYCLLAGLLLALLVGIVASIVALTTSSRHRTTTTITATTTVTGTTITSITTSTSTSTITSSASTSVTTITTTTTTTTAATTVTITSNTCTSTWNNVSLYNFCTNCTDIDPYQQYTYTYVAIANQTRITFAIREDTGYFALDDVSVTSISAPTVELTSNGGFEVGTLSSWIYCNPAGSSFPGTLEQTSSNFSAQGHIYSSHSGNYYYLDGAVGQADYLSQMISTTIGQTYNISFWLYNHGSGTNSNVNIIISI